jgi:hypothetical protein
MTIAALTLSEALRSFARWVLAEFDPNLCQQGAQDRHAFVRRSDTLCTTNTMALGSMLNAR